MSKVSPQKPRMSTKRFRLLLVGLLVVGVVVVALFGGPLAFPFTIEKVTFAPNTFTPITPNGGFELIDNSWAIAESGSGVAVIVSGGAASGDRSLYIHDPGQSAFVWYNDSTSRVLPLLINNSIAFGFDLFFTGNVVNVGTSSVWVTLFLWYPAGNETFPLTMVLGNYSMCTDSDYNESICDKSTASAGIIMLRGVRAMNSWTNYELQLGTPRVDRLIEAYLLANSSTLYNPGDPVYVVDEPIVANDTTSYFGFRIAPDNADAHFDNVAFYNVARSTVSVSLSKSTLLPSNLFGLSTTLNGYVENATVYYGATSETLNFVSDLPLAYNATYQVVVQTGWSTSVYLFRANDTSLPSWI